MKYFGLAIWVLVFTCGQAFGTSADDLQIQFKTSQFYSHYMFAQSFIIGVGASSTTGIVFRESKYASDTKVQQAIRDIQEVNIFYEYKYEGYPKSRHNGVQLWQLLKLAASKSKDIDDFGQRIMAMVPMIDLIKFTNALKVLAPVHDELIWNPNQKKLKKYISTLQQKAEEGSFTKAFKKAAKFYDTKWDYTFPFNVFILPIPQHKEVYETATPEGNTLTYLMRIDKEKDVTRDLGVIFHELCHVLYQNQDIEKQNEWEAAFFNHSSSYRILGYQVLDEALATALGQGWYYKLLEGKLDETDWYAVDQINGVAKATYSLVEKYVASERTLDLGFVNEFLSIYELKFSDDLYDIGANMSNVSVLISESYADPNALFSYFFENFDMRSIQDFSGLTDQNFNDWTNELGTKMIIAEASMENLSFLKSKLPDLAVLNIRKDVIITSIQNGVQYYIIFVSNLETVGTAMKQLSKQGRIESEQVVLEIE